MIAALCGVMFDLFYGVSWTVIGHNLPPASPALSAVDLAAFYVLHHNAILLGKDVYKRQGCSVPKREYTRRLAGYWQQGYRRLIHQRGRRRA